MFDSLKARKVHCLTKIHWSCVSCTGEAKVENELGGSGLIVRRQGKSVICEASKKLLPTSSRALRYTGGGNGKSRLPAQSRHIAFIVGWVRKLEIEAMR
ncbi:hypothetical protein PAAG_01025 [Paracoccidioides lutzii Pb01]|uniref:Uncharacterized protein n=1 Tax=Paracoccidioides lutzii (strain ATCC MYA-826 / Pb01) TaxID=502779 RepID=C1GR80_PARBA|nr:hypothetical protein PAAG_01025 [Paracoccidioides lutzii Pb01]EEH38104.2 hypothetical protein PAAG_01025 [Paracoccidioides lutzii Pb01]